MADTMQLEDVPRFNAVGRTTGTTRDLAEMEFLISCPPDLPPRSRIVAVCGMTDVGDSADPREDGWFMSDFYLFWHLLSPTETQSPNQFWLTCESPESLVKKYTEYAHGDSRGERRIVLDQEILSNSSLASSICVVPRKELLDRFLNTVREQAQIAHHEREQLVLLIFGHGEDGKYGVSIGGNNDPNEGPKLRMNNIKRLLPPDLSVTILLTSCYSGGWLVYPDLNRPHGYSNTTSIAAAAAHKESHSWPISNSIGRTSGSIAASAIVECLIKNEEASDDAMSHPTYIDFACSIQKTVNNLHFLGAEQEMHFSAENDEWEMNYKARIGLPLTSYKDRWQSLRSIPPSALETDAASVSRTGSTGSRRRRRLQVLARAYLDSQPGVDSAGPNVALHNKLRSIVRGTNDFNFDESKIDSMINAVTYRLGSKHEADYHRSQMGIDFPSIFQIEPVMWRVHHWRNLPPEERNIKEIREITAYRLITENHLLTRPIGGGLTYHAPKAYLALALAESDLSLAQIETKIHHAALNKKAWFRSVYRAWRGPRVAENEAVMSRRRALMETVKRFGWKITERDERLDGIGGR